MRRSVRRLTREVSAANGGSENDGGALVEGTNGEANDMHALPTPPAAAFPSRKRSVDLAESRKRSVSGKAIRKATGLAGKEYLLRRTLA